MFADWRAVRTEGARLDSGARRYAKPRRYAQKTEP